MRTTFMKTPLVIFIGLILLSVAMPAQAEKVLMMATTTSTDNTGLLNYLAPLFQKDTGIELRWTATGTGKALELGKNCDVDVLMVHAPEPEMKFVADGYGVDRKEFMYNDFVIIGPANDPAGIKGKPIAEALSAIKAKQAVFTSRGDKSGTHTKELSLWAAANMPIPEKESWYIQTGQGMLPTINVAAERDGYTMTDRGTYIAYENNMKGNPPLKILVEGDKVLLNQYSMIAIPPKHCTKAQYELATELIKWITGKEGQQKIKDFKLLGKQLFYPNAK
jgi:tungstate transport system substrate-binding protein